MILAITAVNWIAPVTVGVATVGKGTLVVALYCSLLLAEDVFVQHMGARAAYLGITVNGKAKCRTPIG